MVTYSVFKLKLKYNLAYRINTVKLKSNANMQKVNMIVQRSVILLLVLVSLVGCKDGSGKISSRDEVEMVRIPMISGYTKVGDPIYQDFYMDVTEVTVGQFKKFLKSSDYSI
jgi:hypothetical protein